MRKKLILFALFIIILHLSKSSMANTLKTNHRVQDTTLSQRMSALTRFYQITSELPKKTSIDVKEVAPDIFRLQSKNTVSDKKYAFIAATHGDEVVGIDVFSRFVESLILGEYNLNKTIYFIIGNKSAYIANKRYIQNDLNRLYGIESPNTMEEKRAQEIRKILDICSYSLDLHQTIEPTKHPFLLFPYSPATYHWARALAPDMAIITTPKPSVATTSTSYMAVNNKIGLTIELGDKGFDSEQIALGFSLIKLAVSCEAAPQTNPNQKDDNLYTILTKVKNHHDTVFFHPSLYNFKYITKGESLGKINDKELFAEKTGYIILYPQDMINQRSTSADGIYIILEKNDSMLNSFCL